MYTPTVFKGITARHEKILDPYSHSRYFNLFIFIDGKQWDHIKYIPVANFGSNFRLYQLYQIFV